MSSSPSTPTSSPSSSHVTSVFSQGPPSQNTRSSVMNRTLPPGTPPASYQVAIRHIQERETAIAASIASAASRNHTPSPSYPIRNSDYEEPVPSTLSPSIPSSPTQHPLPDSSFTHHHSTPLRPPPLSIHQPSSSYTSTSNTFNQPSPMTVDPSLIRYQMMQEHMDTMHSDIASLGHKHDHAMTAMGEMNDNIDILTNNIGGIDSNVAALKDLILSMGKKMQPPVALPRPALVPSILLPRPGIVPSAIPHDRSSPVSRRPAPKPVIHQPQLPDRVPLGHVQSMSQASSFTSVHSSLPN